MRRRTRGRGRGGARGGGSTSTSSRNNNSTTTNPVIGQPTKSTTILTAFHRQSSPYIRQLRGGIGRTIKKAIDSIISDNDIMNNNTFPTSPMSQNGTSVEKLNGHHVKLNGENSASNGYLHKKFKKVTSSELSLEKNGIIPNHHNKHYQEQRPLTPLMSREEEPRQQVTGQVQNGIPAELPSSTCNTGPSVYKPKFRLATANDQDKSHTEISKSFENVPSFSTSPALRLQVENSAQESQSNLNCNNNVNFNVNLNGQCLPPRHHSLPLPLTISPGSLPNGSSSNEQRFDRKSLDDRISKIINENQSILATWPEHLSKRTKGNGGRYSLGARSGTTPSFGHGFGEPSRRDSLDFVMSSSSDPNTLSKLNGQKSLHFLQNRSNSDVGLCQDGFDSLMTRREDLSSKPPSDSFTVPKKRRRLSPVPGILSGGEVAEIPKDTAILSMSRQDHVQVPSVRNSCPQLLQVQKEMDMTLRLNSFGNSGAKVTIMTPMSDPSALTQQHRMITTYDESSSSSTASSSRSHFSPDQRQNLIRIRKNSIFESDASSSPTPVVSVSAPPAPRRRGRPSKVHHEEAPKIRKVVERLQSHLNAKTAALAALAATNTQHHQPSSHLHSIPKGETPNSKSALHLSIAQKSITTTSTPNNQETIKVPEAVNATISKLSPPPPPPSSTSSSVPKTSSLLLQTAALNPKRPTFLALKPTNGFIAKKRLDLSACILPSPETPRGAKNYNQMHINGNAYTYLGFKISTKSSYTCLFKPQPMFVPQETDPKLSMYSNWQPRPKDSNEDYRQRLSTYDSRVNLRRSGEPLFVSSVGNHFDTLTINSPENTAPKFTLLGISETPPPLPLPSAQSENTISPNTKTSYANVPLPQVHSVKDDMVQVQVPTLTVQRSRSCTPPPTPDTPELTIDERPQFPQVEVTPVTSPPKTSPVLIQGAPNDLVKPLGKTFERQNDVRSNDSSLRIRKKSIYFPPASIPAPPTKDVSMGLISSESSSAEELATLHLPRSEHHREHQSGKGRSVSLCIDSSTKSDMSLDMSKPLALTMGGKDRQRSQSVSLSSPSAILNNLDSARVKIMEGGFESNEDYTYIRGRGRGRYVCESCGIRCKKPSMLRKHLKTHTDLRPYTCKLCNFSFKTKGNLTKHQKSKSHHKKCIGLGIHPDSSRSLEMTGPLSDSNDEGDSDDDDEEDEEDNDSDSFDDQEDDTRSTTDNCNDKEKFEKEIALSLLDLSQVTRLPEQKERDRNISESSSSSSLPPNRKLSSFSSPGKLQSSSKTEAMDFEAPMDLSVKPRGGSLDSQSSKLFGGGVKSMEVVGEAQRWEPEEEFLRTGSLNLKKVRNASDEMDPSPKKTVGGEDIKIEVSEPQSSPAATEDKPFEFEITKRRQTSSSPGIQHVTTSRTSSHSLSVSSPLRVATPPRPASASRIMSPIPSSSAATSTSAPKRLHQPWLSPPEASIGERDAKVKRLESERIDSGNSPLLNGGEASSVPLAGAAVVIEKEEDFDFHEDTPTPVTQPLTIKASPGGNGIKLPSTSSDSNNFQGFGGLLALKPKAEFRQPSGAQLMDDGKAECNVCGKTFVRACQLTLHMNIHYLERPFRCDPCGVSFRTKGHLLKHRRSSSHDCKVYLTEAWGVANEENPRPFKCADCKIAFRIHGHLAKHLRSKMHIMRMECLGKLPFGIYFEMEKTGLNLNEIDTTDCDLSLVSLQGVAQKIYGDEWRQKLSAPIEDPA